LGIQKAHPEWKCVGYSEIDKYAIQTYEKHFPEHKNYGDATKINPEELPKFDLLVGGFPCQAFSIAGRRKGFEDTRGTLFYDIARILESKRPRYILFENVKGLLNHDKGKTFTIILKMLWKLGYYVEYGLVNSRFFGVPQNRERVFIVGSYTGERRAKIFPIRSNNAELNKESTKGLELLYDGDYQSKRIYSVEGISPTIPTSKSGGNHVPFIANHWFRNGNPKQGGTGMLTNKDVCFCLDRTPHYVNGVRRLTPIECERLQGFPDGWTEGVSETQRYTQCGNAVTVNVIECIARCLPFAEQQEGGKGIPPNNKLLGIQPTIL